MKRIKNCFLFLLLACALISNAQGQEELFPTGTMWKEIVFDDPRCYGVVGSEPDTTTISHIYEIGADTIIGSNIYKKVLKDGKPEDYFIREEGRRVWMKADIYPQEFKLYDFNWDADSITLQYLRKSDRYGTTILLEEITIDLKKYVFTVSTSESTERYMRPYYSRMIAEGIGCVSDLMIRNSCLLGYLQEEEPLPGLIYTNVLWMNRNGRRVFRMNMEAWTVAVEASLANHRQPSTAVYDLQGRIIENEKLGIEKSGRSQSSMFNAQSSILKKGIYIRDGRKVVVR